MKMKRFIAIVMALFFSISCCSNSNDNQDNKKMQTMEKQEIQVAAAASLTDVTKKLASEFKKNIKC